MPVGCGPGKGKIMKLHVTMLAAGLAVGVAPGVRAEDAAAPSPDPSAHAAELLDIFERGCLRAFPAGLGGFVASMQGEKLSRDAFVKIAREEPTRPIWSVKGRHGDYVIEAFAGTEDSEHAPLPGQNPPCAVFTTAPADLPVQQPFGALKARFVAEQGLTLDKIAPWPMPPQYEADSGLFELQFTSPVFSAFGYAMVRRKGEAIEYRLDYSPPRKK